MIKIAILLAYAVLASVVGFRSHMVLHRMSEAVSGQRPAINQIKLITSWDAVRILQAYNAQFPNGELLKEWRLMLLIGGIAFACAAAALLTL